MSKIKKKMQDFKNIIDPYQKQLSDWYKKDKNVKKFIDVFSLIKINFLNFIKKTTEIKISYVLEG